MLPSSQYPLAGAAATPRKGIGDSPDIATHRAAGPLGRPVQLQLRKKRLISKNLLSRPATAPLADELEILGRFFLLILGDRPQSGERTRMFGRNRAVRDGIPGGLHDRGL